MGRYDNLKIYTDQNTFIKPKRVYVKTTNGLIDLGLDDSDNTVTLNVYTSNNLWERVTLNKHVEVIPGTKHTTGSFSLDPGSGYCCCTETSSNDYRKATWYFRTKVKRVSFTTATNIFRCGSNANYEVKITWNADGTFTFRRAYGNNAKTYTTSDAFNDPDTIYQIDFTVANGTHSVKIKITNTTTEQVYEYTGNIGTNTDFIISNATNTVGSDEVQFYDYLQAQGVKYRWNTYTKNINLNTATSGTTGDYKNLNLIQEPDTEIVTWE